MDYITIAQVDGLLGADWAAEDKKARAVLMANTWLTAKSLPHLNPVPDAVIQAGAEIAREAADGKLYGTEEREVVSTSVKAGPVTTAKTFAEGARVVTAGEAFALALIRPYLGSSSQIKLVRG